MQDDYSVVTLIAVANPDADSLVVQRNIDGVLGKIRVVMGEGGSVTCRFVEDIPREPSGKYLYIVSRIPQPAASPLARIRL